jgi:biotin carboxyl carrier protein
MKYITTVGEQNFTLDVNRDGEVTLNDSTRALDFKAIDEAGLYSIILDNQSFEALVEEHEGEYRILIDGVLYNAGVVDERASRLASAAGAFAPASGEITIKSPMPGLIVAIPLKEGDVVEKGQVVVILESMKMENELKSPKAGTVHAIKVQPRQAVEQGQALVVIG